MNDEAAPEKSVEDLSPLAGELAAAETLVETAAVLLRALEGESESSLIPHSYVSETYKVVPRRVREDVDQAVLTLLAGLSGRVEWNTDAAVGLLLLTRRLFVSRDVAQAALVSITRILAKPEEYAPQVAVAAGQAGIALGYYGSRNTWKSLYDIAGDLAVPTVIGGLARADWKALLAWLADHRGDPWIERTTINLLPAFLITQGPERVREIAALTWNSTSESRRNEILSFMKRNGLEFQPVDSPVETTQADWPLIIRSLLSGELAHEIQEAGDVATYVRRVFVGRDDASKEFTKALNYELNGWRDPSLRPEHAIATMLDLIGAFEPDRGPAKAADLLDKALPKLGHAITMKAIGVLLQHYGKSPENAKRNRTYIRYVQALRRLSIHPEVGRIALDALLKLGALDFTARPFVSMVIRDEAKQQQVVDFAVADSWNLKLLSWLLDAAVRESTMKHFVAYEKLISTFRRHGDSNFHVTWQGVVFNRDISIAVTSDLAVLHAKLFQRVIAPGGHQAYENVSKD